MLFLKLSARICVTLALTVLSLPLHARAESAIPQEFHFTETLKQGSRGEAVRYLQILLNQDVETTVNSKGRGGGAGNETTFLGEATTQAIIKFQNKYKEEVLLPAHLLIGNGTVGQHTRAKLNSLLSAVHRAVSEERASQAVTPVTTQPPAIPFDDLNSKTRAALVNILCVTKRGGFFDPISGSGVMIDPRGVILTNAHVGQYFLLKDFLTHDFIDCTIRTGEPARSKYRAKLLYLSPLWIGQNASKVTDDEATSTGENDFALLLVQGTTSPDVLLPTAFPYLPVELTDRGIQTGNSVLVAGYPAGFLSGITIERDLYPSSSIVTVGTIFGFHEQTPDIFSIGGSVVAQQGSSGGAVVNTQGNLIGIIVTSSKAKTTGERNLNALTMSHLDRSIIVDTGKSMSTFLSGDVAESARLFNQNTAPLLKQKLIDVLTHK